MEATHGDSDGLNMARDARSAVAMLILMARDLITLDRYIQSSKETPNSQKVLKAIWSENHPQKKSELETYWLEHLAEEVAGLEMNLFNLVYHHAMIYQGVKVEL